MGLPKGVVKGIKDNFDVDALELKLRQQEEEIKKLQRDIAWYRFQLLTEDERRGVSDTYGMLIGESFGSKYETFIQEYMQQRDEEEARKRKEEWDKLGF